MAWIDPREAGANLPPIPTKRELDDLGIRVAVGIPLERTMSEFAFRSLWTVAQHGWTLINTVEKGPGYGRTDVNREMIARKFLETDFTHLAMLDTDHVHPPEVINRLARWFVVRKPDGTPLVDVVYGVHFRRGEPYEPMIFKWFEGAGTIGVIPEDEAAVGLIEVDAAAHGSMIISRRVLEAIAEPWWAYDYSHPTNDSWPSEDMWFCRKVREAGFTQAADLSQTSPHMTIGLIDQQTFANYQREHPLPAKSFEEQVAEIRRAREQAAD